MESKKKICFVVSTLVTVKAFLIDHITELSKHYDVYIVANCTITEIEEIKHLNIKEIKNIPIHRKINIISDIKSIYFLYKYFIKNKFFITHSVTPKAGLICSISSFLSKNKHRIHIFTGQVWHTKKGIYKKILRLIDKFTASLNTIILVDSKSQMEFLINNKVISANKSYVLGIGSISGVNISKFSFNNEERLSIRAEHAIPEGSIVYIFLGRLNKDKGIYELLQSFKRLSAEYSSTKLALIGFDEENIISSQECQELLHSKKMIYINYTNSPEKALLIGDIFCLPSHREGFGTSVIEASSIGLPAICSDTYGLRDTIIEGKTGLRHKVGDADSLYIQMKLFAENINLIKEYGNNGKNYVHNNFDSILITSKWVEFYHKLA